MSQMKRDTDLAFAAAKLILDGRDPVKDRAQVLITLDHTIASLLVVAMEGDARKAAAMFEEGVVPHVIERISMFATKRGQR